MKKITIALLLVLGFSGLVSAATTHTVKRGDTLWDMAKKYYGDPTLYTIIAEVNGVTNPRTILDGTVLIIPNKSDMQAIAAEKDASKRQQLIQDAGGKTNGTGNKNNNNKNNDGKEDGPKEYVPPTPEDTELENIINNPIRAKKLKKAKTNAENE